METALRPCSLLVPSCFPSIQAHDKGFRSKEPEAFTSERGHLEPFLAQVDVFLRLNPGCFINDSDQILWFSTLLRGVAHQWFYPHLSAVNPPAWLVDYPLFVNQLHIVFGDPDRIATAKQEIEVLSQTTSVANYLTQFCRLQMTLNWDKDAMAWFFYRGLKENVKDDLSHAGKPTDLETLIQRSLEIDNRIAERISEKKRTITQLANPTPMPASNPPIAPTTAHPSSPSALRVPLTTAGKLDPEEYKRCQTNNLSALATQARTAKHRLTAFAPVDSQPPGNQYLSTSLCFLSPPSLPVHYIMIDSGATTNFIESCFATLHSLPLTSKPLAETLLLADGKTQVVISKEVQLLCLVAELFPADITFQVTDLGLCPIILGLPWLKGANPSIDWQSGNITTRSPPLTPSPMAPSQWLSILPSASLDIGATAFDKSLLSWAGMLGKQEGTSREHGRSAVSMETMDSYGFTCKGGAGPYARRARHEEDKAQGAGTATKRTKLKEHADGYHSGAREMRAKGTITGRRRRSSV
ncbi:uncharacterized protein UDID_18367 [Ustilago sp. UG-2017a]|nr:uncharacterized protein UDID_18367 [Ustilago sp. UG-2017a]